MNLNHRLESSKQASNACLQNRSCTIYYDYYKFQSQACAGLKFQQVIELFMNSGQSQGRYT